MTIIPDVFWEIPAPNKMVTGISKNPCFRALLERQHGKWVETLLQSEWQHLCNIY